MYLCADFPRLEGSETSLLLLPPCWYALESHRHPFPPLANFSSPLARIFGSGPLRAKEANGYISDKYPVIVRIIYGHT